MCYYISKVSKIHFRPAFGGPAHGAYKQPGAIVEITVVSVEQHNLAAVLPHDRAMSRSGIAVVARHDGSAASLHQRDACGIDVRTGHFLRAPAHYLLSTLGAAAAKIIGNKKIIVPSTVNDEGRLDGTVAGIEVRPAGVGLDGIVGLGCILRRAFRPAAQRKPFLRLGEFRKRLVQTDQFDAAPEGTEAQPPVALLIDNDIGIYGVPKVAACNRTDDASVIFPSVIRRIGVESAVGRYSDGGCILSKGRAGIVQIVQPVVEEDVGSPGMPAITGNGLYRPLRSLVENAAGVTLPILSKPQKSFL